MANRTVTYIIWFFFGWTGLHHLYLGRLNQAIVWFATLGGCGVGWIRDIWRIPDYLEWCNGEKSAQQAYLTRALKIPRPGCSVFRFAGMIFMGFVASIFLGALVPDFNGMSNDRVAYYSLKYTFLALLILGNATGVYLVANIGELQCSKYYPFLTSILITPWLLGNEPNMGFPCFLTALVTWYKGLHWRPVTLPSAEKTQRRRRIFCKNVTLYTFACAIWLSVVGSGIYFNATITVEGGEKIPMREALNNFFKSEAWRRTKDSLYRVFNIYWHGGARRAWEDASGLFDFTGEVNAYKLLDIPQGTSQDEITRRCRKLSAKHHPDRFKTQTEKDSAQEMFYEIQHACSVLSASHARRSRNMKPPTYDDND